MMVATTEEFDEETEALRTPPYTEASNHHPMWLNVQAALREVYDPEIPVNIYELGLIYKVDINEKDNNVFIQMTFTSPSCPVVDEMPNMMIEEIKKVEGIGEVEVDIVWDPTWEPSMMAETAKLQLNMY